MFEPSGPSATAMPTAAYAINGFYTEVQNYLPLVFVLVYPYVFAIQKGTRVLISLWDSLMFGRVLKSTTIFWVPARTLASPIAR